MTRGIVGGRARLLRQRAPTVLANAAALTRTFAQLLQNAAAAIPPFMPAANTITLRIFTDAEGHAVVEVADTGVGIPCDVLGRVFDAFFTTTTGTSDGLGLTIARADVLAAGGSLTVASVEGRGTCFWVRLPPALATGTVHGAELFSSELPSRRVLVACDDPVAARRLRRLFEDERTIVVDTTIDEAIHRLARGEPCDLVVADALNAVGARLRARLAEVAPDALMRLFEIAEPAREIERRLRPSGPRLAVGCGSLEKRGASGMRG